MNDPLLDSWLDYISNIYYKDINYSLDRIKIVAKRLKLLASKAKVITVAGTNGKGSTVAVLEKTLVKLGHKVGTYTSPHLLRFNERIRINSIPCSSRELNQIFCIVNQARQNILLTYFEYITIAALYCFKMKELDYIILEVGMGGNLDAVNVLDNDLAIITSIGVDHVEYLGSNREVIGFEKAGVFRKGKPVVCGDPEPPNSIINYAKKLQCDLNIQGQDFGFKEDQNMWQWWHNSNRISSLFCPSLDLNNVSTAFMALALLGFSKDLTTQFLNNTLRSISLLGRFTTIKKRGTTILDVGHNAHAALKIKKRLEKKKQKGKIYALFAINRDKDYFEIIKIFKPIIDKWHIPIINNNRLLIKKEYQELFKKTNINKVSFLQNCLKEIKQIEQSLKEDDYLLVFGSFKIVSIFFHNY